MRSLESALAEHELVILRVIGDWWELELTGADKTTCVKALAETLKGLDLAAELSFLPPEEADAMQALVKGEGRLPVGTFSRQYGEVRQMGPAALERDEPWYEPVSAAEALWYRGFLYRGYDKAEEGEELIEYFFIPQELYAQLPRSSKETVREPEPEYQRLTPAGSPTAFDPAVTTAVDDVTTILAFAQREQTHENDNQRLQPYLMDPHSDRFSLLVTLLVELGFMRNTDEGLRPTRSALGWLRRGREAQLRELVEAWSGSSWNDLCHTPNLQCEGSGWSNEPIAARTALLDVLPRTSEWYCFDELLAQIKENDPDFQRPEGNYDTWYIRDKITNTYLKGFESWELVEGRLLRFLIEGPLYWLGMVEVGEDRFQLTERALQWLGQQPVPEAGIKVPLVVQQDATLLVPHNADRFQRFQVARVAEPLPLTPGQPFQYRLTPASLAHAQEAGIRPERVLEFLREASGRTIPASVTRAVERWSDYGLEAQLQPVVILRVRSADILDKLRTNARTQPYIGEQLGDMAAVVHSDRWQELQGIAAQLGLLLEITE